MHLHSEHFSTKYHASEYFSSKILKESLMELLELELELFPWSTHYSNGLNNLKIYNKSLL